MKLKEHESDEAFDAVLEAESVLDAVQTRARRQLTARKLSKSARGHLRRRNQALKVRVLDQFLMIKTRSYYMDTLTRLVLFTNECKQERKVK